MSKNKTIMKQAKINETSGSVPEFIQKLFRMLENQAFKNTFCWNGDGTTFIVKDTNEFSKSILPKHFKHSNFASFVRQLNKYDFHKVRNGEDGQKPYGDQAWEFIHPKFIRDRKDLLEDIKRKAPGNKTKKEESPVHIVPQLATASKQPSVNSVQEIKDIGLNLQLQIDQLKKSRSALEENICQLKKSDEHIMSELANFNKSMAVKDNLIKDFLRLVTEKEKQTHTAAIVTNSSQAQHLLDSFTRISQNNSEQMTKLNEQLNPTVAHHKIITEIKQENNETASAAAAAASMNAGSLIGSPLKTADGLTFVTLGRLSSNMSVRDNQPAIEIMAADQTPNLATALQRPTAKRKSSPSTSSPSSSSQVSWTVPPRILLVDDDSVYRDLSGKLLQIIGCTIDLAKDGVEALKKMGMEKYDLILMDIVMPKMDGISATRSIRQYDALTPIISMTSNFTDNDIMQYIGSGMTDILPKPFSKRTLYQMLEKYCAHLKTIQRVTGLDPSTSLLNPSPLNGLDLLPISSTPPPLTPQPQQQHPQDPPPPPYSSIPSSNNSTPPTSTPTAFPLAPYPYPVTMNSVPNDITGGDFNNSNNGEIPNVTFWPQQQPQQQDPLPAIIPNDGKFTWAVPNTIAEQSQIFDPVAVALNESKRRRMNQNE
ncbi:hypothetical protein INT47_005203 [Mucor saturninus]|uniref:Transcription factor n=1 Tax=Mucor saturninus TaxID=64648 RepID=A0A8H7V3R4_9FUNG|nr:hypothetical protein INT47_005203 [Mucor saturninus]